MQATSTSQNHPNGLPGSQQSQDSRLERVRLWLTELAATDPVSDALDCLDLNTLRAASSDASFRRYFRVDAGAQSLIVMDAPPPQEDVRPFIDVAQRLASAKLPAPKVLAQHVEHGFLLLEDLGPHTFLDQLTDATRVESLYASARQLALALPRVNSAGLPIYDAARLQAEMDLFVPWFLQKHHELQPTAQELEALARIQSQLVHAALAQPQGFVHRDLHSRNLMVREDGSLGVLDFQDAVCGPLTYDLVSLLRDAYVLHDEAWQIDQCARWWQDARQLGLPVDADFGEFYRQFEWMGLQRHLKVLGIFARLWHRDGKAQYLNDLPVVQTHVRRVAERYGVFRPLLRWLDLVDGTRPQVGYTF